MKTDTLKLGFTYAIVGFVVVAGLYVIYQAATHDLPEGSDRAGLIAVVGGFVGMCIQFVTGAEIATRSAITANSSFATGASASTPTITANPGPPPSVTVTSSQPAQDVDIEPAAAGGQDG